MKARHTRMQMEMWVLADICAHRQKTRGGFQYLWVGNEAMLHEKRCVYYHREGE